MLELPPRPQTIGMNSLRDLRSSLVTSRYQLPQLISHYVLYLCVTCQVPDVDVKSVFESFGVVHSVHPCFFRQFPSVAIGTRRLVMSFRGSIPSSVSVFDFPVGVFHAGQPVTCSICHESAHLPRDCPFSGLCLRCKQPGHMAQDCPQPWGPSSSSSSPPVPTSSAPVSSPQFVPSSVPCSSSSVPASTIQSTPVQSVLSSAIVPSTSVSAPVPSVQS